MSFIFKDNFETGNISAWSSSATDGTNLAASASAALVGNYGLSVTIPGTTTGKYVRDNTPNDETAYSCRFYIDTNSISMAEGAYFYPLRVFDNVWNYGPFYIKISRSSGNYRIALSGQGFSGTEYIITDEPHYVDIIWKRAATAVSNDGEATLLVDGLLKQKTTGINNFVANVGMVFFGAGFVSGTINGTFYLDEFYSRNDNVFIGKARSFEERYGGEISIGVNYKSANATNIANDISYFRSAGVKNIRMHITEPESADFTDFLAVAETFYNAGFYVIYGFSDAINAGRTWANFRTDCLASAARCVGKISELCIGNEMDYVNDDGYISDVEIRNNLKILAVEIKQIFTGKISYATGPGYDGDIAGSGRWVDEGIGSIDEISINTYGSVGNPYSGCIDGYYMDYLPVFIKTFGESCYVSEFNVDADTTNYTNCPEKYRTSDLRMLYESLKNIGFTQLYLFQWRGYRDMNDEFAVKRIDGSLSNSWLPMVVDNKRLVNRGTRNTVEKLKKKRFGGFIRLKGNNYANRIATTDAIKCTNTSDFSCGAWVKVFRKNLQPGATEGGNHVIYNNNMDFAGNKGYDFGVAGNRGCLYVVFGNSFYYSTSNVMTYGKLMHVAFTLTGTTLRFYVNKKYVSSQTVTRIVNNPVGVSGYKFGEEASGAGGTKNRINGWLTECFATTKLLTLKDIEAVADGDLSAERLGPESVAYSCNEMTGTSLVDATGHGFTGTLEDSSSWVSNDTLQPARNVAVRTAQNVLKFDGNYSFTEILPYDSSILSISDTDDYSFGAVVNLTAKTHPGTNDDAHNLLNLVFDYGTDNGLLFGVNADVGTVFCLFGADYYESDPGIFTYGEQHHIAFTLTGTTFKAYIDAVLVWTQTVTRKTAGTVSRICMEDYYYRGVFGKVSNMFFVKSELSQSQIALIKNGTIIDGLDTYYKIDEGKGFVLKDYSGNNNFARVKGPNWTK